ncbi:flagellar hook assembly protein FlgD [Sedimenticola selenatireducens]|uniref:Basal-body rod modification protein FlgD n=2 Tax=Sedimenticola selenatireducens TaxID=191960 RepID=A0A2N6CRR6_9GAMM|nr:flagellar hook assembly protein FlgD [Sedimenticola selenatireducens]PLX59784.1 MAG: flagellar hook capping protein [Sedimenticola selenatireducens]
MSSVNAASTDQLYQTLGLSRELEEKKDNELGMEDFLELMVTELTHQDPTKPMDNSELATQISQFAAVSGIDELNNSFSNFSDTMISDQALQAANLVGRDVLVPVNTGNLEAGGSIKGVVGVTEPASDVTVRISDASGELIKEIQLGTQPKGEVSFTWDGLDESGEAVAPGQYQIEAQAKVDGESVTPYTLIEARVGSVSIGGAGQGLTVNLAGLGPVSFSSVAEIR